MIRILVSACLLGEPVRYNGKSVPAPHPAIDRWLAEGRIVPLCPELAGGLPVPRPPAERQGERVITIDGADVTAEFTLGAERALETALRQGVRIAILKENSPSCGSGFINDGTFSHVRIRGRGVAAERLAAAGIALFSEHEIDAAAAHLEAISR
jgi:uncharacterized protein YbbK (DUF523 family)